MINKMRTNNSEVRAEQATNVATPTAEAIYLGTDLHKNSVVITRIIDQSTPQPAQRFDWEGFWKFVHKQVLLAKQVYLVYEAGAFGFWLARKLKAMSVECFVVHPEKLDPRHKRVQTDKLDSRHLADKLQRYILGNKRAMIPVHIPTQQEEERRLESRTRRHLLQLIQSQKARGRGLLLSQGFFETQLWWKDSVWEALKPQLSQALVRALEPARALIAELQKRLREVEKQLEASAPQELPRGLGRLTFVLLSRELCNYQRFRNRRGVGGFTGLCGAVSSSGEYHADLSINKAGNPYVRTLLIELAWRMIYWQPSYKGLQVWHRTTRSGGGKRRRKMALVAVARQLAVDIWRWQTGSVSPEALGWQMSRVG